jgi:plasmid stabilization system protein ParE
MKPVTIHPAAADELRVAAEYYGVQQEGLGLRFVDAVANSVQRIQAHPELYRAVDFGCRKCRVPRFPYGLIYRETEAELQIIAVMHLRRDPNYWQGRAGGKPD